MQQYVRHARSVRTSCKIAGTIAQLLTLSIAAYSSRMGSGASTAPSRMDWGVTCTGTNQARRFRCITRGDAAATTRSTAGQLGVQAQRRRARAQLVAQGGSLQGPSRKMMKSLACLVAVERLVHGRVSRVAQACRLRTKTEAINRQARRFVGLPADNASCHRLPQQQPTNS